MRSSCPVVAMDGPACVGKGTYARRLATEFGFKHLDTGLLYRGVTLALLRDKKDYTDSRAALEAARDLDLARFTIPELQSSEVNVCVSVVAAMSEVRQALFEFQRNFPQPPGAVIDGRDIGTVIFPDADIKLYIIASPEARAIRALNRLRENGSDGDYENILRGLIERDRLDSMRAHAPMKPAEDAVIIDTTHLDRDQAYAEVLRWVREVVVD